MKPLERSVCHCPSFLRVLLPAAALAFAPKADGITSYWVLQDANGTWNNEANWSAGIPKNPGDIAIITNNAAPSVGRTITIDTPVSLKALKFAVPTSALSPAYTVQLGTGGSLTMNSGDGSRSAIHQLRGSSRCKITANTVLSNDVDIINAVGAATYFDVANPMSGNFNLHINTDGSTAQPYMTVANSFVGDTTVYAGKLLISADCFGSTTNGTRVINLVSNGYLRLNSGSGTFALATNRQVVTGIGGGAVDGNSRLLLLTAANQLAGEHPFTLYSQNSAYGGLQLNAENDNFSAPLVVHNVQTLRLSANGTINHSPLIVLTNATAILDVLAKPSGYAIPSNQILAGIGVVSGRVNTATAGAVIHPGICAAAGTSRSPGILTLTGGLSVTNGGCYAWDLAQLKDSAFAPGTTTYSQLGVTGSVSLAGGTLSISFLNGIDTPDTNNAFWKTNHTWTVLSASEPPSGTLDVVNGTYANWSFTTRVTSNTLELVYGPYTPPQTGTLIAIH